MAEFTTALDPGCRNLGVWVMRFLRFLYLVVALVALRFSLASSETANRGICG
jgi:hypothetical protein